VKFLQGVEVKERKNRSLLSVKQPQRTYFIDLKYFLLNCLPYSGLFSSFRGVRI